MTQTLTDRSRWSTDDAPGGDWDAVSMAESQLYANVGDDISIDDVSVERQGAEFVVCIDYRHAEFSRPIDAGCCGNPTCSCGGDLG